MTASSLRVSSCASAGFLCRTVLFVAGLAPFLAPSVARADLYVVDGDIVGRFNTSTGAIVQTNGQNAFTTLLSATGITAAPDGLIYVATTDPTSNPGFPVVNRYNATTGLQVGGAFVPYVNGAARLSNAQGMAFGPDGHFYVADLGDNGPVKSFSAGGGYLDTYATQVETPSQSHLTLPLQGIFTSPPVRQSNKSILRLTPTTSSSRAPAIPLRSTTAPT